MTKSQPCGAKQTVSLKEKMLASCSGTGNKVTVQDWQLWMFLIWFVTISSTVNFLKQAGRSVWMLSTVLSFVSYNTDNNMSQCRWFSVVALLRVYVGGQYDTGIYFVLWTGVLFFYPFSAVSVCFAKKRRLWVLCGAVVRNRTSLYFSNKHSGE